MKKNTYFFLLMFLLVFMPLKVNAFCDDSESIRMSKLAQNLKFSYTYNETTKKFTITVANMKKDLIVEYLNTGKRYSGNKELNFYNLSSGKHTFMIYSNSDKCSGEYINTKYINTPFLNDFYNNYLCENIENYAYCQKWLKNHYSYEYQYNNILEYKNSLKTSTEKKEQVEYNGFDKIFKVIRENYVKYYYIILPIVISILCLIIYIKNKKENLV